MAVIHADNQLLKVESCNFFLFTQEEALSFKIFKELQSSGSRLGEPKEGICITIAAKLSTWPVQSASNHAGLALPGGLRSF